MAYLNSYKENLANVKTPDYLGTFFETGKQIRETQQYDENKQRQKAIEELSQLAVNDHQALNKLAAVDPDRAIKISQFLFAKTQRAGSIASSILNAPMDQRAAIYSEAIKYGRAGKDPLIPATEFSDFPDEYSTDIDAKLYTIAQGSRTLEDSLKSKQEAAKLAETLGKAGNEYLTGQKLFAQTTTEGLKARTEAIRARTEGLKGQKILADINKIGMESSPTYFGEKERITSEAKEFGKENVKFITDLQDKGISAQQSNDTLDVIQKELKNISTTGPTTNLLNTISSVANQAGIKVDTNKIDSAQAASAAINKLVLSQVKSSGLGSGQGFSNADRDFLASTSPKITNSVGGNIKALAINKAFNQKAIDISNLTDQLKNSGITDKSIIRKAINNYSASHPVSTYVKEYETSISKDFFSKPQQTSSAISQSQNQNQAINALTGSGQTSKPRVYNLQSGRFE